MTSPCPLAAFVIETGGTPVRSNEVSFVSFLQSIIDTPYSSERVQVYRNIEGRIKLVSRVTIPLDLAGSFKTRSPSMGVIVERIHNRCLSRQALL